MVKNVDDYYSSLSSDSASGGDDAGKKQAPKKKILVKKKLKIKPKTEEKISIVPKEVPVDVVQETTISSQESLSLNDALERESISKLKIVSRAQKDPVKEVQKQDKSDSYQNESLSSGEENEAPAQEKKSVKFKAGFSKSKTPTGAKKENPEEQKNTKKSKLYNNSKKSKYRNNFDDDNGFTRSNKLKSRKKEEKKVENIEQNLKAKTGETVQVGEMFSVKEFSEKIWVPLPQLIAEFMKNGMMLTINSQVDFDTASLIAESFEVKLEKASGNAVEIGDIAQGNIKELIAEDDNSRLSDRPPVISIMGHVDHGKTSLLDHIRHAKVAAGEAGWITQSIGAYQVEYNDKKITFLDTPGHEAFTVMRSRGAKSTDIAILVVAADEGVKPQTIESISHAKEAGIPVIVAVNKMDKEWANPDHVKWQLSEHGLVPEDWGGDTPVVPVSAHTGFGIDELLEIILLVAEMQELKANPNRRWVATVIESHLDPNLGPVATVLVNTGTISKTDAVVCAGSFGKIKVLKDYTGKSVKFALPGDPVLLVGLDRVVEWGDILQWVSAIDEARDRATQYQEYLSSQKKLKSSQLDILMNRIKSGNLKHLKIVVKADTNGSLEAIKNALLKLSNEETSISIIHSGVGDITEGDVLMCGGSSAILVGFGVQVWVNARNALESSGVEYIESKIIYHITERIEKIVSGMLDPKEVETVLCHAKVGGIFYTSKKFLIVGLILTEEGSSIEKNTLVRVIRGDKVIGKGNIESLKQWVEEVSKLEGPIECGVKFVWMQDIQEKDIFEVYKITIET